MVSNISRLDLLSDHFLISFKTNFTITTNQKISITYRPINHVNSMIFLADLHSALGDYCYSPVVLNSILSHLLDKYAPSKTISVTLHPDTPWFTSHLMSLKRYFINLKEYTYPCILHLLELHSLSNVRSPN